MAEQPAAPHSHVPSHALPARHGLANYLLLAFLGTTWGSSFLFIKVALTTVTPLTLASARILFGGLIVIAAVYATGQRLPKPGRVWLGFIAIGLVGSCMPFVLINGGQTIINASLGSILITTVPLFTLMLAHWFTDDKVNPRKIVGVVLGFSGIVVLIGPAALAGITEGVAGQLMIVGAALCFAVTTVIARRLVAGGVTPVVSSACSLTCAFFWTVPLVLIFEKPWALSPDMPSLLSLAMLALFSTGIAMLAFFRLARTAGPNFVAMNNYIAPAVGVTWGVLLLDEPLTWRMIIAMAAIFTGIAIATTGRRR